MESSDASSSDFTQAQWARQQLLAKAQREREKFTAFDSGAVSKQAQWAREQIFAQMKDGQEKGGGRAASPRTEEKNMKFDPSSVSQQAKWAKEQLNLPEYNGKYGRSSKREEGEGVGVPDSSSSLLSPLASGEVEDKEERRRRAAIKRALFLQSTKEPEQGTGGAEGKEEATATNIVHMTAQAAVEKVEEKTEQRRSMDIPNYLVLNNFDTH
eukprot:98377-Hanusia_phi.AAC.1